MGDIHGIPDDVLELILLRLASSIHLTRAAATCRRWHGIAAGARFLRRFGSLDGGRRLFAGSYYNGRFLDYDERERPAFVASSSLPAAAAGRFSLDFLWPDGGGDDDDDDGVDPTLWRIVDSRGGLLLWAHEERYDEESPWRMHMAVCEPLTRRYRVIPPLVSSGLYHLHSGPFLLDAGGGGGGVDLSSFRVMCVVYERRCSSYRGNMFTSRGRDQGSWRGYSVVAWEGKWQCNLMGRTRASLYWHTGGGTVEALDRRIKQQAATGVSFSSSRLPAGAEDWDAWGTQLRVAAGRDGEARVLAAGAGGVIIIKVFALPLHGGGEWALEKTIQLPAAVAHGLPAGYGEAVAAAHIYVTDTALVVVSRWVEERRVAYRLDVETGEAELMPVEDDWEVAFPCELPWPPVLRHRAREQFPAGGV
ncbi:unnamed protein product [Urochloa humidicola]